jgi:hypothetical protein
MKNIPESTVTKVNESGQSYGREREAPTVHRYGIYYFWEVVAEVVVVVVVVAAAAAAKMGDCCRVWWWWWWLVHGEIEKSRDFLVQNPRTKYAKPMPERKEMIHPSRNTVSLLSLFFSSTTINIPQNTYHA